jgi:hypothetical protein
MPRQGVPAWHPMRGGRGHQIPKYPGQETGYDAWARMPASILLSSVDAAVAEIPNYPLESTKREWRSWQTRWT